MDFERAKFMLLVKLNLQPMDKITSAMCPLTIYACHVRALKCLQFRYVIIDGLPQRQCIYVLGRSASYIHY